MRMTLDNKKHDMIVVLIYLQNSIQEAEKHVCVHLVQRMAISTEAIHGSIVSLTMLLSKQDISGAIFSK